MGAREGDGCVWKWLPPVTETISVLLARTVPCFPHARPGLKGVMPFVAIARLLPSFVAAARCASERAGGTLRYRRDRSTWRGSGSSTATTRSELHVCMEQELII